MAQRAPTPSHRRAGAAAAAAPRGLREASCADQRQRRPARGRQRPAQPQDARGKSQPAPAPARAINASRPTSRPRPSCAPARGSRAVAPPQRREHQHLDAVAARPAAGSARPPAGARARRRSGGARPDPAVSLQRRRQRHPGVGGQLAARRERPARRDGHEDGDAVQVAHPHQRRHPAGDSGDHGHPAAAAPPARRASWERTRTASTGMTTPIRMVTAALSDPAAHTPTLPPMLRRIVAHTSGPHRERG